MKSEPKRKKGESKKYYKDRHNAWSSLYSKPLTFFDWLNKKLKEWL